MHWKYTLQVFLFNLISRQHVRVVQVHSNQFKVSPVVEKGKILNLSLHPQTRVAKYLRSSRRML